MTRLLDLPNELLVLIAKELLGTDFRRFTKICQRTFLLLHGRLNAHLIRKRLHSISIHQYSAESFVLTASQTENGSTDNRAFCFVSHHTTEIPSEMWNLLEQSTVPKDKITWKRYANVHEEVLEILSSGTSHFEVEKIVHKGDFKTFDVKLAQVLFQICKRCELRISNDGFSNETVQEMFVTLVTTYLNDVKKFPAARNRRILTVCEQFTRKCCPTSFDESERIKDSLQRVVEAVRSVCQGEKDNILKVTPCMQIAESKDCITRSVTVTLSPDESIKVIPLRLYASSADTRLPCSLYHEQFKTWLPKGHLPEVFHFTESRMYRHQLPQVQSMHSILSLKNVPMTHQELLLIPEQVQEHLCLQQEAKEKEQEIVDLQQHATQLQGTINLLTHQQMFDNRTDTTFLLRGRIEQLQELQIRIDVQQKQQRMRKFELQKISEPTNNPSSTTK